MSKDYPDRAKWLAVRATPRKLPSRMFHLSAPIVTMVMPDGSMRHVARKPGFTYRRPA